MKVDAGGGHPVDLDEAGTLTLRPGGGDATGLANRGSATWPGSAARADSVVVTGPAWRCRPRWCRRSRSCNIALPVFLDRWTP